jgi:hypothetical protein
MSRLTGWASLALGMPQLLAPAAVNRWVGVRPTTGSNAIMRAVGVQELLVGTAIIRGPGHAGWLWTRLAGDVLHFALLGRALHDGDGDDDRIVTAGMGVAGIALVDLAAALRVSVHNRRTATQHIRSTVTVNCTPDDAYRSWRQLDRLPRFMAHVEDVQPLGEDRWRWAARAPGGKAVTWDAEVVRRRGAERRCRHVPAGPR